MRRKDREITDISEILEIIDKAKILHLGLFDSEFPYVVPLHYGYEYSDNTLVFYLHGAGEGYKLDLIRKDPRVCVQLDTEVTATSGEDVPCNYGSDYASVIARGTAEILQDTDEKIKGLKLLMKNQTGRDFEFTDMMASSVAVIKITVSEFTAKRKRTVC